MAQEKENTIILQNDDDAVLRALRLLEWYCLEKRGISHEHCKSCIMSHIMRDGEDCPFEGQEAPGDWEIGETLSNGGPTIKYEDGRLFNL